MKKCLYFVLLLSSILFACSSDDNKEEEIVETKLKLSVENLLFSADKETIFFDIECNTAWKIVEHPDWCTVYPSKSGEGDAKITINVEANNEETIKEGTIKIEANDKSELITVIQNGKNVALTLNESELSFSVDGGEKTFLILSNEKWTITDIPEWCSFSTTEGENNKTITVTLDANLKEEKNEAIITVNAGSKSQKLAINQEGMIYTLEISYPVLNFYSDSDSKGIIISSNTKWTVSSDATWCTPDKAEGEKDQTLIISVLDNPLTENRSGKVIIKAGSQSKTLQIEQTKLIVVSDNPYQFNLVENGMRPGDYLTMKQVEYKDPGPSGENIAWVFKDLITTNDNYTIEYALPPIETESNSYVMGKLRFKIEETPANSLIVRTEHNTMYYFQVKDDFHHALGHENPSIRLMYDPHMIMGKYPTYYNNSYKYDYKGSGLYSGTIWTYTQGHLQMKADAYGSIQFPTGTVKNVIRIKYEQLIVDAPANGSINTEASGTLYTIHRWYAKGYRYPVFEAHRSVRVKDNTEVFKTAFYYPPEMHTYLKKEKSNKVEIIDNKDLLKKMEKYQLK